MDRRRIGDYRKLFWLVYNSRRMGLRSVWVRDGAYRAGDYRYVPVLAESSVIELIIVKTPESNELAAGVFLCYPHGWRKN